MFFLHEGLDSFPSEKLSIYFLLLTSISKRAGLFKDNLEADDEGFKSLPRVFIFKRSATIAVGRLSSSSSSTFSSPE